MRWNIILGQIIRNFAKRFLTIFWWRSRLHIPWSFESSSSHNSLDFYIEIFISLNYFTLCIEFWGYKLLGFFAMMKGNWFKLADSPPVKRNVANLVLTISYKGLTKRIAIRLIRPTHSSVWEEGGELGRNLSLSGFVAPSKNVHVKKKTSLLNHQVTQKDPFTSLSRLYCHVCPSIRMTERFKREIAVCGLQQKQFIWFDVEMRWISYGISTLEMESNLIHKISIAFLKSLCGVFKMLHRILSHLYQKW